MNKQPETTHEPSGVSDENNFPDVLNPSESKSAPERPRKREEESNIQENEEEQTDKEREIERTATDSFTGKKPLVTPLQHPCGINW